MGNQQQTNQKQTNQKPMNQQQTNQKPINQQQTNQKQMTQHLLSNQKKNLKLLQQMVQYPHLNAVNALQQMHQSQPQMHHQHLQNPAHRELQSQEFQQC